MLLLVFIYLAIILFFVLSIGKAVKIAKMPMHNRWEIYPVPIEKGRSHYGGSFYEEYLWWEKPREKSLTNEIVEMLKEMFFIKNLFDNQRTLWWFSFPFHFGMYLVAAWTVLLWIGSFVVKAGIAVAPDAVWWASLLYYLTLLTGIIGGLMFTFGSLGLLFKRIFDLAMKNYTTPQEYFNLTLLFATGLTGLILWASDPFFHGARELSINFFSFQALPTNFVMTLHLIFLGALIIYIPSSKMSHYVGKYFTFHKVLWENEPNLPGSNLMKKIEEAKHYPPGENWSATHFHPTGEKTVEQ